LGEVRKFACASHVSMVGFEYPVTAADRMGLELALPGRS
jgi:hypothetical protein